MSTNPLDTDGMSEPQASVSAIGAGVVVTPPVSSGSDQYVSVMSDVFDAPIPAQISAPSKGDVIALETGQPVLLGYMSDTDPPAIVLGHRYINDDTVPSVVSGERVIGHVASETTIRFKPNGDLVIDGGSKGVIHDIDITTDAGGHVADITLHRRDDILI